MGSKNALYCDIESGHPEVTGSSNFVLVKFPDRSRVNFVVDVGLFQEKAYDELNNGFIFNPEDIDFVLTTHNHVDHIGRLPLMAKREFKGKIYATKDTSLLMPHALEDSQKVLTDIARRNGKRVLYSDADVVKVRTQVVPVEFNQTIQVSDHIKATFFINGHLQGAALILVQISYPDDNLNGYHYEDINLLFTGDYNNKNMFFDVPALPEWVRKLPLTVIQESTYGYMNSDEMKESYQDNVTQALNVGKTVVVPVFALGRSQEILYVTKCMQESGKLDVNIPIYYDGKLGIKYTRMFLQEDLLNIKPEMKDFLPKNLTVVDQSSRGRLLSDTNPKIICTTSGMASHGPAQTYLPRYIAREDALIHFTGYTAEGTLGHRLKTAKDGEKVEVGGLIARKRADVEYTTEFSAHAKADEMIDFLKQFKNLKLVLINHGQTEVKKQFASRVIDEVDPKDVGILGGEYGFRVNAYGLVEPLSTEYH